MKHYRELRHCWAVMLCTERLMGYSIAANGIKTALYESREEARKWAKLAGGQVVKVRVKYEVTQ